MIPIRLVFRIISISIIFSSAVFGGESPNEDRIDAILALITRLDTKINGIKSEVNTMSSKISEVEHKVEEEGWRFVGMGWSERRGETYFVGYGLTLSGKYRPK